MILHVTPALLGGGVANVATQLTKALAESGVEVVLASPQPLPTRLQEAVVRHYPLRDLHTSDPFYVPAFTLASANMLKRIVEREAPDVVLTHGPLIMFAPFLKTSVPVFAVVHGTYANEVRYMFNHPIYGIRRIRYIGSIYTTYKRDMALYSAVSRLCNVYLIAVSERTRQELVANGVRRDKVFAVLNGVDKGLFRPMDKETARRAVGEKSGVELRGPVLLHVNPGHRKGTHIFIKAMGLLKRMGIDATALIAGRVHTDFRRYLDGLAEAYGIRDRIHLLGYVPDDDLPTLYNAADLTVVPSYSEGSPLVIPESLACGTPVVATDVGGNPEYLRLAGLEDHLVRISKYDFSKELAVAVFRALEQRRKPRREGVASWVETASRYLSIFEGAVHVG